MLPIGYPHFGAPPAQPLAWTHPAAAHSAAAALQQPPFPGYNPLAARPQGAPGPLLANPGAFGNGLPNTWPGLPYNTPPAAMHHTMHGMPMAHQLAASQLAAGTSLAGLARPPYVWDPRLVQQLPPPYAAQQPVSSMSGGQPPVSCSTMSAGNSSAQGSVLYHAGAHQPQQQQQQQQHPGMLQAPASADTIAAAAAAAAVQAAAGMSGQQQGNTSALLGLLAGRQASISVTLSHLPTPYNNAMRPPPLPCTSSGSMPQCHPATSFQQPGASEATATAYARVQAPTTSTSAAGAMPPPPVPASAVPAPAHTTTSSAAADTTAAITNPTSAGAAALAPACATMRPAARSAIRTLMLQQQSTYVQQLFELHKLVQLQQLLACELQAMAGEDVEAEADGEGNGASMAGNDGDCEADVEDMEQEGGAQAQSSGLKAPGANGKRGNDNEEHCTACRSASGSETSVAVGDGVATKRAKLGGTSEVDAAGDGRAARRHQASQLQTAVTCLGNLPKAIRKVAQALSLPAASGAVPSMMVAGGSSPSVVRPVALYLIPCGGDCTAHPAHSAQPTVQQQLLEIDYTSSPDDGAVSPVRPLNGADGASSPVSRIGGPTARRCAPRQASDELRSLVGNTWRYAHANGKGGVMAARTMAAPAVSSPVPVLQPASSAPLLVARAQQSQAPKLAQKCEPLPHKVREKEPQRAPSMQDDAAPGGLPASQSLPAASATAAHRKSRTAAPPSTHKRHASLSPARPSVSPRPPSCVELASRPSPMPSSAPTQWDHAVKAPQLTAKAAIAVAVSAAEASLPVLPPLFIAPTPIAPTPAPAISAMPAFELPIVGPAQPVASLLAPCVDLQAAWFAKHFHSGPAAAAKPQPSPSGMMQQCSRPTTSSATIAALPSGAFHGVKAEPGFCHGTSSGNGVPHLLPARQGSGLPGTDGDVSKSAGTAALPQPVRWWRNASTTFGAVPEGPTSTAPALGEEGRRGGQMHGSDAISGQGMQHTKRPKECHGSRGGSPADTPYIEDNDALRTAAVAGGFQRFKRNARKQASKHASNRITAHASCYEKSNASGGSGSESVVAQPDSPRPKKNLQTGNTGEAYKKARSAAGILLSLSAQS